MNTDEQISAAVADAYAAAEGPIRRKPFGLGLELLLPVRPFEVDGITYWPPRAHGFAPRPADASGVGTHIRPMIDLLPDHRCADPDVDCMTAYVEDWTLIED